MITNVDEASTVLNKPLGDRTIKLLTKDKNVVEGQFLGVLQESNNPSEWTFNVFTKHGWVDIKWRNFYALLEYPIGNPV